MTSLVSKTETKAGKIVVRLIAHTCNELFFFFHTFFALSNKAVALEQPSIQTHKEPQTKYHESIDDYYCYTHYVTLTGKLCRLFDVKLKRFRSNED